MKKHFILRPLFKYLFHPYWRFRRGQTLGVRALVFDDQSRVLLVRHTYAPGWMFPGGGVERDETLLEAVSRELVEEVGVTSKQAPKLFGLYANFISFRSDHVALFVVKDWQLTPVKSLEIAEYKFFDRENLPEGTSRATRARLAEVFDKNPIDVHW